MSKTFKPMLAKDARLDKLRFPVIAQPKLDGIRCSIVDGRALARSLKEIPNREIFEYLSRPEFEGLDGELIVGSPTDENAMQTTTSFVMSRDKAGEPWTFYVFDLWNSLKPFAMRERELERLVEENFGKGVFEGDSQGRIAFVKGTRCSGMDSLEVFESRTVDFGFEGVILRNPNAAYKFGRSGITTQECLKLKRFVDGEAEIIGVEELMHNANEARTNELGRTERSTSKAGLVPTGTLGALVVRDLETGVEFKIGTGFDQETRLELWQRHEAAREGVHLDPAAAASNDIIGDVVKYKSFPVGVKDKPRFPVFLGFRDLSIDGDG